MALRHQLGKIKHNTYMQEVKFSTSHARNSCTLDITFKYIFILNQNVYNHWFTGGVQII